LKPSYAEAFEGEKERLFRKFIDNMEGDFEEMLVAKGYSIRGPYDSYDEIVFSDKTETDLLLETDINFSYEWSAGALRVKKGYKGTYVSNPNTYFIDGRLAIGGKINLVIKESLTQEKLWIRSISLEEKMIPIKTAEYKGHAYEEVMGAIGEDVGLHNPLYLALNEYYQKSLKTAWNHLDPNELTLLKSQVKELRKKKGY
jgi:hypothetical protein